jgi:hypothetical protein
MLTILCKSCHVNSEHNFQSEEPSGGKEFNVNLRAINKEEYLLDEYLVPRSASYVNLRETIDTGHIRRNQNCVPGILISSDF